jgi:hypothetical protein
MEGQMRIAKTFALAALFGTSLSMPSYSPNADPAHEFPALAFESAVGDGHGNGAFLRIGSDVQLVPEPGSDAGSPPDTSGSDHAAPSNLTYRYVYTFHNAGTNIIKINFSEGEVINSPY